MRIVSISSPGWAALLALVVFASPALADSVRVYRCPGADGVPLFTDEPCRSGHAMMVDGGKPRADWADKLRQDRDALDRGMAQLRARQEREQREQRDREAERDRLAALGQGNTGDPIYTYPYAGGYYSDDGYGDRWSDRGSRDRRERGRDFKRDRQHTVPVRTRNPRTNGPLLPPVHDVPFAGPVRGGTGGHR
jgi:hypothetical protein